MILNPKVVGSNPTRSVEKFQKRFSIRREQFVYTAYIMYKTTFPCLLSDIYYCSVIILIVFVQNKVNESSSEMISGPRGLCNQF